MSSSLSPTIGQALSLRGLFKTYGATRALDGVDLTIGRGEVVALMGANGAGKSTLAKIASGVVRPDHGRIIVAGREVLTSSPQAARAAGIVIVHQSTDQLGVPGLTVAENLILDQLCGGGAPGLISRRQIIERATAIAGGIGLDIPLDQDFGALGPAHRQLVAIARAIAAEAPVLILDEPTASLSASEAEKLFVVIDRLRQRGVGVLYISHRLGDIRRVADRIVILRNGRRVADQARPFDLVAAVQAMIGRDPAHAASEFLPGAAGKTVLRLSEVRLTPAAKSFNLALRAGDIVALTGTLGAGKSRLLGALFGLAPISSGTIELDGRPWRPASPAQAIANGVFMAGEDWQLGPSLDALDDLLHGVHGVLAGHERATVIWSDIEHSRAALGRTTTRQWLQSKLEAPGTFNTRTIARQLDALQRGEGPTYFEIVMDIFASHRQITLVPA